MHDIGKGTINLLDCKWSVSKDTSGTNGMFLKSRKSINDKTLYLKLASYNSVDGFYGYEPVLEIVAGRVADYCGFEHIQYKLFFGKICVNDKFYTTMISASEEYRVRGDKRVTIESYVDINKKSHIPTEFLMESKWSTQLRNMMALDYIIYNRDRHGSNMELLYNNASYRLVPIFDNGCCLTQPLFDKWKEKDSSYYLVDGPVNNYLGSKSLLRNLHDYCVGYVSIPKAAPSYEIMEDLDIFIERDLVNFLYEMLKRRYENAVAILYK